MAKTVGVIVSDRILAGLVVDHKLAGPLSCFPENVEDEDGLIELNTETLVSTICSLVMTALGKEKDVGCVGVALPGFIRNGVVEEAPNLPQLKGARIQELLSTQLRNCDLDVPVTVVNDADGLAAGLAATSGRLEHLVRVWTLEVGIGYGHYPFAGGVWEGGHTVVSIDDKERFCGCGGHGHMEGIMGHRAMRLRFLDMEPEEVFESANSRDNPEARCVEFKRLWHKALAAATASAIHVGGAGKFYLTGFNVRFVDLPMLKGFVKDMVKMSPLQGYSFEIIEDHPETRVIGSAVSAEQAAER